MHRQEGPTEDVEQRTYVRMRKIKCVGEEMERRPFITLSTGRDEVQGSGVKAVKEENYQA